MSEMFYDFEINENDLVSSYINVIFNVISRQILQACDFFDVKFQKRKPVFKIYIITFEK